MKLEQLHNQSPSQLQSLLDKERQAMSKLVSSQDGQEVKNVRQLRTHRKTIARILTLLRQKQLAGKEA